MSISQDLFHASLPHLEFVIRAVSVFLFVLLMLRLGGKRQIAQMSPTEFVAMLLISNAVQNSMNGGDNSLIGGFILAASLVATSTAISYFTYRSRYFSRIFEGTPTLIIHDGKIVEANMRKERITHEELRSILRRQNVHHCVDVQSAVLEPDGNVTVMMKSDFNK